MMSEATEAAVVSAELKASVLLGALTNLINATYDDLDMSWADWHSKLQKATKDAREIVLKITGESK